MANLKEEQLLSPLQKQVIRGGMMLALGCAFGVIVAPDDPEREDKLAALGSASGSAVSPVDQRVDVAEYHRVASAARRDRDAVDLLTEPVAPGARVVATVNMPPGARPEKVDLIGLADGRFDVDCQGCGLAFDDIGAGDAGIEATVFRLTAQNTSKEALRLTALVYYAPAP